MSNKTEPVDWNSVGWAFLGLLALFAWLVTMVGQFVGVAWYFPWIFFGLFVFLVVKTSKVKRVKETPAALHEMASPNEIREAAGYKLPHLTSIPGQYTRKPCTNPEWIQIKSYRDYEINCETHQVRNRHSKEVVEVGYDPEGINPNVYLELFYQDGRRNYVHLERIVEETLGRGHA